MDSLLSTSPFFEGDVGAAVQKALSDSLLLCVVLVAPGSHADDGIWQDLQLAEKLRAESVCVRYELGSSEQQYFSSVYGPVAATSVPCFYIVGSGGSLLKVVNNVSSSADVLGALAAVDSTAKAALKQRLEQMRAQRAEQEAQHETQSELQRREAQKSLADAKRMADMRARDAEAAKTKRAAEESRRHRDDVVAKIRAEKEERKRLSSSGDADEGAQAPSPAPVVVISVANRAKLRFQVAGAQETLAHEFAAADTFGIVREYLRAHGHGNVTIESVHPRRVLGPSCDVQTLSDLRLVPSATLVVTSASRPAAVMRAIGGVLRPNAQPSSGAAGGGAAAASAPAAPHPNVDPNYVHPAIGDTFFDNVWAGCVWLARAVSRPCRGSARSSAIVVGGGGGAAVVVSPAAAASPARGGSAASVAAARRRGPYVEVPTEESTTLRGSGAAASDPEGNLYFDSGPGTFTVPRNDHDNDL